MDQESKLSRIYEGWKNSIFKTPQIEAIAKKRAAICSQCTEAKLSRFSVSKGKKQHEVEGMICGDCKCPLYMKTRSPHDHCPKGKW